MKKSKNAKNGSFYLIIGLVLVSLFIAYYFYTNFNSKKPLSEEVKEKVAETYVDTSNWSNFPNDGSDFGWIMQYPQTNKPVYVQNSVRFYFDQMDNERAMIDLNLKTMESEISLDKFATTKMGKDTCDTDGKVYPVIFNAMKAYKYSGKCTFDNGDDTILAKPYTVYFIGNPKNSLEYLEVTVYSDSFKITEEDKLTIEKMLNTISF